MKRPMYLSFQRGLRFRARPRGHKSLLRILVHVGTVPAEAVLGLSWSGLAVGGGGLGLVTCAAPIPVRWKTAPAGGAAVGGNLSGFACSGLRDPRRIEEKGYEGPKTMPALRHFFSWVKNRLENGHFPTPGTVEILQSWGIPKEFLRII